MWLKYLARLPVKQDGLAQNAIQSMMCRVLGAVLVFLLNVILARVLGVAEYGIYTFVISCISIAGLVAALGFDTSLNRFIPQYIKSNDWSYLNGVLKFAFRASLISSLILALAIGLISYSFDQFESRSALLWALPLMVILVLTNIRISVLRALKRYVNALLPETLIKPMVLIVLVLTYFYFDSNMTASESIILHIIAAVVSFIVGGYFLKTALAQRVQTTLPSYQRRFWMSASLPMLLTTGATFVISQTDIIMLGALKDFSVSGIYGAVSRLASVAVFFMAAINFIVAPLISEAYYAGDTVKLSNVVQKCTRYSFLLALFVFIACYLMGETFLGLFGIEFRLGYYALIFLLIGHVLNTGSGPVGLLLSLTGNQLFAAKLMVFCAAANIVLNYVLISKVGLEGAAIATMLTTTFWNFLMLTKVRQELGFNSSVFGKSLNEES